VRVPVGPIHRPRAARSVRLCNPGVLRRPPGDGARLPFHGSPRTGTDLSGRERGSARSDADPRVADVTMAVLRREGPAGSTAATRDQLEGLSRSEPVRATTPHGSPRP